MKREIVDYIEDIIGAMDKASSFVESMNYDEFVRDVKTVYAVIRAIEIIGEAVKNIPEDVRKNYPEIPWKNIAGMRDKVIHAYFGVNLERIWQVIQKDIPVLKPEFEKVLMDMQTQSDMG